MSQQSLYSYVGNKNNLTHNSMSSFIVTRSKQMLTPFVASVSNKIAF